MCATLVVQIWCQCIKSHNIVLNTKYKFRLEVISYNAMPHIYMLIDGATNKTYHILPVVSCAILHFLD